MKTSVIDYCAAIGADPLLVQGAGGNVSWKDGDTLWVKASGTWLSDAAGSDIFVPVDLVRLQTAMAGGDFSVSPMLLAASTLRPSIETLLHALMPHKVVVHLHAIEILAYLVRHDFQTEMTALLGSAVRWSSVPYLKPGAALAEAIFRCLTLSPQADALFLQNHGVVIGGASVAAVDATLHTLLAALRVPPCAPSPIAPPTEPVLITNQAGSVTYLPASDPVLHQLATNTALFDRLETDWVLYPDHVVFLGARPFVYASLEAFQDVSMQATNLPELVFVREFGVLTQAGFNQGKQAQLRCYHDVLVRQLKDCQLDSLSDAHIAALLNWDAEKYRIHIAK